MARTTAILDSPQEAILKPEPEPKRPTQVTVVLTEHAYDFFARAAAADERPVSKYIARILNRLAQAESDTHKSTQQGVLG